MDGVAKKVSPGYYSTGGADTTRTGQSKCAGNAFYCANGVRKRALRTQYTTGGTPSTRTGVKKCKSIEHCAIPVVCSWPDNQKCLKCEDAYKRVQGKSDKCVLATITTSTITTSIRTMTCGPGLKLTTECVPCGSLAEYCVDGVAKKVVAGYYSIGGTHTTRTGQSICGGNTFYCVDGVRKRALKTQYTTGGTPLTRTGAKQCKSIEHCATPAICSWPNNQKCLKCEDAYKRVAGKSDTCIAISDGINAKKAVLHSGNCAVAKGSISCLPMPKDKISYRTPSPSR